MSPQSILRLQRTIGNTATQRVLNTNSAANSVVASQGLIGNAGIQRMLTHAPASVMTLQRRLDFAPGQLTGKAAKTGIKKLFDNPRASTFREIENALASFHKTARDDAPKLRQYLSTIIDKSDLWLGSYNHIGTDNDAKRVSLENLREAAWIERRRVIITKEIGVPYQIVDTFDAAKVEDFWKIVTALDARKPQEALGHFDAYQGYLGDAAVLVKQFMMRNQIHVFNPQLAASMNTANSQMDPKEGDGAKQLIVNEARAKLEEYKRLKDKFDAETTAYQAEVKKNPNTKLTDYKMLNGVSEESRAFGMLRIQKDQYQGIVDGTTIPKKQKEKGLESLTEAELYGIVGYTSNLYSTINSGCVTTPPIKLNLRVTMWNSLGR